MKRVGSSTFIAVVAALVFTGAAHAITPMLRELEDAFVRIGEQVRPAVVNIDCEQEASEEMEQLEQQIPRGLEDFFKFFDGPINPRQRRRAMASGSGFIYDKEGRIITNNHVISGAKSITVRLHTGVEYKAEVVGADEDTDIAVIKLISPPDDLHVAELGDSDTIKVGQFAIALGSPRGLEGSLSFGHVSALGRDALDLPITLRFQNFIQTDAAINFGNSGGPLVDIDGRVIGINTAIDAVGESLGFAIPINMAKEVVPQLIASGKVTRGFLGVNDIKNLDELVTGDATVQEFVEVLGLPDSSGAYVNGGAIPDSPAEKAGIKQGDVIRKINGETVTGAQDLVKKISRISPGETVKLEIWRDKASTQLDVTLAEYPGNVVKARLGEAVLGMRVQALTPDMKRRAGLEASVQGVIVLDVETDSPADNAEIGQGDIITEVQQRPVATVEEFKAAVKELAQPGTNVLLRVMRMNGQTLPILVKVPEAPKQ